MMIRGAATLVLFLTAASGALAFDGALVTRTSDQTVRSGDVILWQSQSYEEGGNWWKQIAQPGRLEVVSGVSKVRVRFSVTLSGTSTGRICAFAAYFKAGVRTFMPGLPGNCVNADNVGTTEVVVHSAAIPVQAGDFFELAVNIFPDKTLTALGTFGITWAAIEKVE